MRTGAFVQGKRVKSLVERTTARTATSPAGRGRRAGSEARTRRTAWWNAQKPRPAAVRRHGQGVSSRGRRYTEKVVRFVA
jgi:hypothetical protein